MPENADTKPGFAVVLAQAGGPEGIEDARRFTRSMLRDPRVVATPTPLRWLIAELATIFRAREVARRYRLVGGRSPVLEATRRLAEAVGGCFRRRGRQVFVTYGFTYSRPSIGEALVRARNTGGGGKVVVVPLFPQFSFAVTGAVLDRVRQWEGERGGGMQTVVVRDFAEHAAYVSVLARTVQTGLRQAARLGASRSRVLFCAHGIPSRYVRKGDPYPNRVVASARAVVEALGRQVDDWQVCYQSRLGPLKWLQPYIEDCVARAAPEGFDGVVLVPLSFVSENMETLYDLDIHVKELARRRKLPVLVRVPTVDSDPAFAWALVQVVEDVIAGCLPAL